ncbi:hypothetical protein HBB16_03085 [Pseudonocardia sp. MCCB 268]|nr:hypothetical protein [Pseudonocardia cytotoxica]
MRAASAAREWIAGSWGPVKYSRAGGPLPDRRFTSRPNVATTPCTVIGLLASAAASWRLPAGRPRSR